MSSLPAAEERAGRRLGPPLHRQMYVDLARSYVRAFGTQRDLARAIGVSDAYVSGLLTPPSDPPSSMARHPSPALARRLADVLCPDPGRREHFLDHLLAASRAPRPRPLPARPLGAEELDDALEHLERKHRAASFAAAPTEAKRGYVEVVEAAECLLDRIDPDEQALAYARVLLYLHDVACVLDRSDQALWYARLSQQAIGRARHEPASQHRREWLEVHADRAEMVALNTLGLSRAALERAEMVYQRAGFVARRAFWLPLVTMDQLGALRDLGRFVVGDAETLHERAMREVPAEGLLHALLDNRLAEALLAHGTPRSRRKAGPFVERGLRRAREAGDLGPLHRALLLRTAAQYEWSTAGETPTWRSLLRECLRIGEGAGLAHQRRQLERRYGRERIAEVVA